jgi:serine protease Do
MTHRFLMAAVCLAIVHAVARFAAATDDVPFEEEAAIRAAVERVAPSVVRIEAAGVSAAALAASAEASPASGPSTGLVVEKGGWVLATSFAVPLDADEAIVVLPSPNLTEQTVDSAPDDPAPNTAAGPDRGAETGRAPGGRRRVARVVGRDLARSLVLLRIDEPGLPAVAEWAPRAELAVGQWTIAVGRAWHPDIPSVAVGILSATNRSWGRSVQTDASISPANYGGPLIDIKGRVIGILAPLPADTAGMNLGTELYDSGIGFAVPLEDMLSVLPRLKNGETLAPGVLGIGYRSRDPFTGEARIATCRPGSPAANAGLRPGDLIVAADGRPVTRIAELRHVLAPHYAGDTVSLTIERGAGSAEQTADAPAIEDQRERPAPPARIEVRVELARSLPPWRKPMLGIVPARSAGRDAQPAAVQVAWVWAGSPAAKAGIVAGDTITAVVPPVPAGETTNEADAVPVESAAALAGIVAGTEVGGRLGLVVSRAGARQTISVEAAPMPVELPANLADQLPVITGKQAAPMPAGDAATVERLEAAEVAKPPLAVLPVLPPREPLAVIIYLDVPRGTVEEGQAAVWKAAAARHGVAVILPGSSDPQRWGREDIAGIKRAVATLAAKRTIDPTRIAVAGRGAGGAFAWLVAEALGPAVRGVALIDATLPRQAAIEPAEPGRSRWVLLGSGADAAGVVQLSPRVEADRRRLEEAGYPTATLAVEQGGGVPAALLAAWVEALGLL